jgi:nitrite reductase/ring-hydroxylating ferredoxin subunit
MTTFVRAISTADIPNGQGRLWRYDQERIALFRTGAGVHAVGNRCPHEGCALKDGDICRDVLTCARHNWKFRLTDSKYVDVTDRRKRLDRSCSRVCLTP